MVNISFPGIEDMVNISFPGIGIDTFSINPVAFKIPIGDGIQVRWLLGIWRTL